MKRKYKFKDIYIRATQEQMQTLKQRFKEEYDSSEYTETEFAEVLADEMGLGVTYNKDLLMGSE